MDSLIKADIFFFITTVALVIVSVILIIALFYLLRILRDILHLVKNIKAEGDKIVGDINGFRTFLKGGGEIILNQLKNFLSVFMSSNFGSESKAKKTKKVKKDS